MSGRKLPGHYLVILQTFPLILKHNTIKFKIQNAGKTLTKNKYGKFHQINTLHCALFLWIFQSAESVEIWTESAGHT